MKDTTFAERYALTQSLGKGGGGEVWAAQDRVTLGRVAVKVLRLFAGPAEVDALIRETSALSGLEGLGFPRVLGLGRTTEGRLYLVRELVDGESLEAVVTDEPGRALRLLPRVAAALTVVHRAGLLHGDVKPANIIARADGDVALVDLGLATALREGGQPALGLTPHFAAPELSQGGRLGVRGEVYSLGVMLGDLLVRSAELNLSAPAREQLEAIAARSTASAPEDRYPSADEWGEAVQSALGGSKEPSLVLSRPWPVLGVDAQAQRLERQLEELPLGGRLWIVGPRGSGRTTLLTRLSWTLALRGSAVVLVDGALSQSPVLEALLTPALTRGGIVLWDAEQPPPSDLLERARDAGAKLVQARLEAGMSSSEVRFELGGLDEASVRKLLLGALPGLPQSLVPEVLRLVGGSPGPLRRWVELAAERPLSSAEDVRAVLESSSAPRDDAGPLEAERLLDRGHLAGLPEVLARLPREEPHTLWLRARYEILAGSSAQAERWVEQALSAEVPERLRQRLVVARGRAVLGQGQYARAHDLLAELGSFEDDLRAEGWAYLGLSLVFLSRGAEAMPWLERATELAQGGSPRLRSIVASSLATAERRQGNLAAAASSYERAVSAAAEAGDLGMLASAQINLAGLKKEAGDLAASIELLQAAEDAARRGGRSASVQQALLNLINADLYLGRLERARAGLERLGPSEALPASSRAQVHGLYAELHAQKFEVERALFEFEACAQAFEELGRRRDASEALLEAVLVLLSATRSSNAAAYLPERSRVSSLVERGRALLDGEVSPLLRLAEARLLAFADQASEAESAAQAALELSRASGQREWAWRALALLAELLEAEGQRLRAARAREQAVEVLEEIGARLPHDLREVYWSDPRRAALRARLGPSGSEPPDQFSYRPASVGARALAPTRGTDAISRLTQTPLERRLAQILAINSDLASEVDRTRLSTKIVAHAAELLGAERGYLLLGRTPEDLVIGASRSAQGAEHKAFSRSIAGAVLRTGQPLVSIDVGQDDRLRAFESVHAASITAVACVPVLSPLGEPIGALYLETRLGTRPDFGEEMPTLLAFAEQAAIALENARLLEELATQGRALEERNRELSETQGRLRELLGRRTARLKEVRKELRGARDLLSPAVGFRGLVGTSAAMRRIYALIERVQETDVPVLITGESGTGKEVVARAIHSGSGRKEHALVAVNCGAIPESILESELFGHKRGAFTGADRDRRGLFQEATRGTLFLDEIGETPLKMQASLLRALQEKRVRPVGGGEEVEVDVRVVFATNRDLTRAVANGTFREDLLYRIQVVEIALPPLRERREDIPLLVDHFLGRLAVRFGQEKKSLTRAALAGLSQHPLPGNVRQLENILLSAWVMADGLEIDRAELALPTLAPAAPLESGSSARAPSVRPERSSSGFPREWSAAQRSEREQIVEALGQSSGNRVRAAEILGMPRRTLYRRLQEYGLL